MYRGCFPVPRITLGMLIPVLIVKLIANSNTEIPIHEGSGSGGHINCFAQQKICCKIDGPGRKSFMNSIETSAGNSRTIATGFQTSKSSNLILPEATLLSWSLFIASRLVWSAKVKKLKKLSQHLLNLLVNMNPALADLMGHLVFSHGFFGTGMSDDLDARRVGNSVACSTAGSFETSAPSKSSLSAHSCAKAASTSPSLAWSANIARFSLKPISLNVSNPGEAGATWTPPLDTVGWAAASRISEEEAAGAKWPETSSVTVAAASVSTCHPTERQMANWREAYPPQLL